MAGDGFVPFQCRLRCARAITDPALPTSGSGAARAALSLARYHDGRCRESAKWSRPELHHWAESEWLKFIAPDDLPGLKYWESGSELPLVLQTNHLKPPHFRAIQRLIHATALPLLDRTRPGFSANARPQPIPQRIVQQLEQELRALT